MVSPPLSVTKRVLKTYNLNMVFTTGYKLQTGNISDGKKKKTIGVQEK